MAEGMPMIYLAGPLFTVAERRFGWSLTRRLEKLGFEVYYPWRDTGDERLIKRLGGDRKKAYTDIARLNLEAI